MDGAEKKTCGLHKCEPIQLLFPGRTADPLHSGIVFLAVDGDDQIRSRCKHPVLPYQPESVWKPPDPLWIEDMQVVKLRYVRTLLPSSRQHDGVIEQGIVFLQSLNDAKRELFKRAEISKHKRRDVFQLNHCAELLFRCCSSGLPFSGSPINAAQVIAASSHISTVSSVPRYAHNRIHMLYI